jgi:hypothetical protein
MSRDEERIAEAVAESRREVERRLSELRESIVRETGILPKARYALLALVAGSTGFALAARWRSRRKRARKAAGRG